jgi:RNA polymerase sigma-70 factor, ECF subfamily
VITKELLQAVHGAARDQWPAIDLAYDRFEAVVRELDVSADGLRNWGRDLFLACAAGDGHPAALREIDVTCIMTLPGRILRLGSTLESINDVLQSVRTRLFSGPAPRIRAYNAAAPLRQWIKVVAIRTAIDTHRRDSYVARAEVAWSEAIFGQPTDAATTVMRGQYKEELERTLRIVLTEISARDKAVLRLHVLEGMSIERIATIYGVHRVTVARWVWNAGEMLLSSLRAHFEQKFGIVPKDFDSLARLMRSQLSVDLTSMLRAE